MTASMVSIGKLQRGLSAWLNRAAYGGERVIITSHNKPKVARVGRRRQMRRPVRGLIVGCGQARGSGWERRGWNDGSH